MYINIRTQGEISKIVEDLKKNIQAGLAAAVSRHGLNIASSGSLAPTKSALDATVAMLIVAFGAAETAEANLERMPPKYLIINGEKDYTVIVGAGSKAVLVLRTEWWSDTDLEQIQKVADEIKTLLG
jgi:predicted regulator of Ras-like GTPase activity (Roadblock/LC7/MglB family)